mgnify:CR=1 FL=1
MPEKNKLKWRTSPYENVQKQIDSVGKRGELKFFFKFILYLDVTENQKIYRV